MIRRLGEIPEQSYPSLLRVGGAFTSIHYLGQQQRVLEQNPKDPRARLYRSVAFSLIT